MSGAVQGAAAGATAGAAFGPWGAAIGAVAGGLMGAGSGGGSAALPAGPSSNYSDAIFDNSGWTVATGGSRADSEQDKSSGMPSWVILAIAAVVVVGWVRTSKK